MGQYSSQQIADALSKTGQADLAQRVVTQLPDTVDLEAQRPTLEGMGVNIEELKTQLATSR